MKLVKDAKRELLPDLDLVHPQTDLKHVFEIFKFHTVTRVIFVVDDQNKLVGMVDVKILLRLLASSVVKQESLTFFSEVSARTAEDIMVRRIYVKENEPLSKALQIMVDTKTEDLAVVDDQEKITGSLNCFDVMLKLAQ